MRAWWARLRRTLAGRQALDDDLAAEIAAHIDLATEESVSRGMPPQAARTAVLRRFGGVTSIRERAREAWGFPSLESLGRDLRHALRGLRACPGFSGVVIVTLALGIGATTAIFSVVHAVLLAPLPYPHAERGWCCSSRRRTWRPWSSRGAPRGSRRWPCAPRSERDGPISSASC